MTKIERLRNALDKRNHAHQANEETSADSLKAWAVGVVYTPSDRAKKTLEQVRQLQIYGGTPPSDRHPDL